MGGSRTALHVVSGYGIVGASPYCFRLRALCCVSGLPGVEAAFEGGCFVAHFVELPRHPGAGSLIRSGAVGEDALAFNLASVLLFLFSCPSIDLVRGDPDGARDAATILFVLRAGADVEDDGWIFIP